MMTVRLTSEERRQLEELAKDAGLSASAVLRQLVRKAHDRKFSCALCGLRMRPTVTTEGRNPWRHVGASLVCNRCYREHDSDATRERAVATAVRRAEGGL